MNHQPASCLRALFAVLLLGSPAVAAPDLEALKERVAALRAQPATEAASAELREVLALAGSVEAKNAQEIRFLSELGRLAAGQYPREAATFLARSVEARTTEGATDWQTVRQDAASLAKIEQHLGDLAAAESWLRRAVEIDRQHSGRPSTHLLDSLARLIERVRPGTDEAVEVLRESLVGQPAETVHRVLAWFFHDRGDHERVLEHARALLDEPEVTASLPLLTQTLLLAAEEEAAAGRPEVAETLFLRGLRASESQHGGRHPSLVTALRRVGEFYATQARFREAEGLLLRALEIAQRAYGDCPACNGGLLSLLTRVYDAQQRPIDFCGTPAESEPPGGAPPPPDPDSLEGRLARSDAEVGSLFERREFALARERALEGLALRETAYGSRAIELLPGLALVARAANELADKTAERAVLERVLELLDSSTPSDREGIAGVLEQLKDLIPDPAGTKQVLERLANLREQLGQEIGVARVLKILAGQAQAAGNWHEVAEHVSRAADVWEGMAGRESVEYVDLRIRLAAAYRALGMQHDADATLQQLLEYERGRESGRPEVEQRIVAALGG